MKIVTLLGSVALMAAAHSAHAEDITIRMRSIDANGIGKEIGTIRAHDTEKGLRLVPRLSGLKPGMHGFHVHQNPSCGNKGSDGKTGAGVAAGGHYDPDSTKKHLGPEGQGHLGDLPALSVDEQGMAREPVVAPRLKVADLWGRAIMIHEGGDNYSDDPKPLGGGGSRVACARIVKASK